MLACTFFGHGDCYGLDARVLEKAIEALIQKGVKTFYVGNQGHFDGLVFRCLLTLEKRYPHISICVVLAYLPVREDPYAGYSMYPPIEDGLPRFAIERRNQWMLRQAQYCLAYVDHPWGGAYKFAKQAKRRGLTVINLGCMEL